MADRRQPLDLPGRKDRIDAAGAGFLIVFSAVLGLNQVLIKLVNEGLQPVFQAGMRSLLALPVVLAWAILRRKRLSIRDGTLLPGIASGVIFGVEFVFLFLALDHTSVARVSIFFYSMPVWMTLGAHVLIPGDRLTMQKLLGLGLALAGVAVAFSDRSAGDGSIVGDLMAVAGAMGWAAIGLLARASRLRDATSEMQLIYQLAVSPLILLPAALFFGPLVRDLQPLHLALFSVQVLAVVSAGFLLWFRVLSIYPPSDMAAFSFLAPVFGVLFGWAILDERIGPPVVLALAMVSAGIVLINWRRRT